MAFMHEREKKTGGPLKRRFISLLHLVTFVTVVCISGYFISRNHLTLNFEMDDREMAMRKRALDHGRSFANNLVRLAQRFVRAVNTNFLQDMVEVTVTCLWRSNSCCIGP